MATLSFLLRQNKKTLSNSTSENGKVELSITSEQEDVETSTSENGNVELSVTSQQEVVENFDLRK